MNTNIGRALEAKIAAHPLTAIAIAFAAGAVVALANRANDAAPARRTLGGALAGSLGALAMGVLRTAVLEQVSDAAKSWFDSEDAASRDRSVEPFLEH